MVLNIFEGHLTLKVGMSFLKFPNECIMTGIQFCIIIRGLFSYLIRIFSCKAFLIIRRVDVDFKSNHPISQLFEKQ